MLLLVSENRVYAVNYAHPWVVRFQPGDVIIDLDKELYTVDNENWHHFIYHVPPKTVKEAAKHKTEEHHLTEAIFEQGGRSFVA